MDQEEIARRVQALKLSSTKKDDENHEIISISEDLTLLGQQKLKSCLVCKVFSSKAINRETFRNHMPRILQAKKKVCIELIGENIFLLDFESDIDRRHALSDGPWNFFKDMVILKAPIGLQKTEDIVFDEIPIWVQCHNLPIAFMQSDIIRNIGKNIGRVIEVDEGIDGQCLGRYARIRVSLNIHQPLRQGLEIQTEKTKEEICIIFTYEKLPNFCFICGRLGHTLRDCENQERSINTCSFGNWIRASTIAGERKLSTSTLSVIQSSNAPVGSKQDDNNRYEKMEKTLESMKTGDTIPIQDERDKADNTELVSVPPQISLQLPDKDNQPVLMEIGVDTSTFIDAAVGGVTKNGKKTWKRVTRTLPNIILEEDDQVPYSIPGKRASSNQMEGPVSMKKSRTNSANEFYDDHVTAVAAEQPRRLQ